QLNTPQSTPRKQRKRQIKLGRNTGCIWLSIDITFNESTKFTTPFHMCMVANLPPSSADLLYKGYTSFPVTVLNTNARGYRLQHFPSIMLGEYRKVYRIPHGPYIIFFVTTSYKSLSTSASGISTHITSSITFEVVLS
ncbi:unnamed protein product, partial [Onchocerca ochengi]